MSKIKRQSFTLIEVVIATLLISLILTIAFRGWKSFALSRSHLTQAKEAVQDRSFFQQRLTQLFFSIAEDRFEFIDHEDAIGKGLFMLIDEGIDREIDFSGPTFAMLFRRGSDICLYKWPKDHKKRGRLETLYTHVMGHRFTFFDPQKKDWVSDWKEGVPPFIKLKVQTRNGEYTYAFSLPSGRIQAYFPDAEFPPPKEKKK